MTSFELVIFDCDGVLVDSERTIVKVEAEICAEHGWSLGEDDIIRHFVGLSDESMRSLLTEMVGEPLGPAWEAEYTQRCSDALASVRAVDGVALAVDQIEARGVRTCVASSGSHEKMAITLGSSGLLERFAGRIHSATDQWIERGKPAPDLFLHAAAAMGVTPERCAVIEDSPHGVAAALAAGMTPFAYTGGVMSADRLRADGVTLFAAMSDLPDLLFA